MSIANILVHTDNSLACETRFRTAINLCGEFDAHLIAVYVVSPYDVPVFIESSIGPELVEAARQALWDRAAEVEKTCEGIAREAGLSVEWRAVEGEPVSILNEHGRYSDLLVLGQSDPDDPGDTSPDVADHVVMECGTPCLIIPYIGPKEPITDTVLVAWNGSIESARAVREAMPFLQRAKRVEVLLINPEDNELQAGDIPGADIATYLARHGVKTKSHCIHNKQITAGDVLLSHAADISAGLLVTGAYGHNRLREKILGGVTRHLFEHMTAPVLMSH